MSNQWDEAKCRADIKRFIADEKAKKEKDRAGYSDARPYESYAYHGEFADSKQSRRKIRLDLTGDGTATKIQQTRGVLIIEKTGELSYPAEWIVHDPVREHKTKDGMTVPNSNRFLAFYEMRTTNGHRQCHLMMTFDCSTQIVEINRQRTEISNVMTLYF